MKHSFKNKLSIVARKAKSEPDTTLCYRAHKLNVFQIKNQKKEINTIPKCQGIYKFESSYKCVIFTPSCPTQIRSFLK